MATSSVDTATTRTFAKLAAAPSGRGNLAEPALLLAADRYPDIDISAYLARLDDLADAALSAAITDADSDCEAARRLAVFLSETSGYQGNTEHYYDPGNSYFNIVMDRKRGIPITLSLLLIEVGKRLGLPLVGIGFPCHFLTGCMPDQAGQPTILLDAFSGGMVVGEDECRARLGRVGLTFSPTEHLLPVTDNQFLIRMLANLKAVYIQSSDFERAIWAIKRQTQLDPAQGEGFRLLGQQLVKNNNFSYAKKCFRGYLEFLPASERAEEVRTALSDVLEKQARRN